MKIKLGKLQEMSYKYKNKSFCHMSLYKPCPICSYRNLNCSEIIIDTKYIGEFIDNVYDGKKMDGLTKKQFKEQLLIYMYDIVLLNR